MKLLHIDSAATGAGSVTRELTAAIVARWQAAVPGLSVMYRDLDADPLPHLTGPVLGKADPAVAEAGEQTLQELYEPRKSRVALLHPRNGGRAIHEPQSVRSDRGQ